MKLEKLKRAESPQGTAQVDSVHSTEGSPVVAPANNVRKELFTATAADGAELRLVVLSDGRCGIMRAGDLVIASDDEDGSLDLLVQEFLKMAGQL